MSRKKIQKINFVFSTYTNRILVKSLCSEKVHIILRATSLYLKMVVIIITVIQMISYFSYDSGHEFKRTCCLGHFNHGVLQYSWYFYCTTLFGMVDLFKCKCQFWHWEHDDEAVYHTFYTIICKYFSLVRKILNLHCYL